MSDGSEIFRVRAAAARTCVLVVLFFTGACGLVSPEAAFAYQNAETEAQNGTVTTDSLERFLDIAPGTAVRPGTATLVTSGFDLSLDIDLGRVPGAQTFADAFRITNTDAVPHQIRVAPTGVNLGAVSTIAFTNDSNPGDGIDQELIAPGATEILEITTTTAFAGAQSGYLRITQVGEERYFRRDLPLQLRQAPAAPGTLTAVSTAGPSQAALNWSAPASTNVGGYNIYRATAAGGPYMKINASLVPGTSYTDSTVSTGTRYWYRVRAIADGVSPELEGLDSNTASGRVPPTPTSVAIPAGGSNPAGYINFNSRMNVTMRVALPAATEAGETLHVEITDGLTTVGATAAVGVAGAQNLNVSGINASALTDGSITLRAWLTKPNETGAVQTSAATKDTVAAVIGSSIAATATNSANYISIATGVAPGTATGAIVLPASSMATDTVSIRLTQGALNATGSSTGTVGAGTRNVTGLSTNGWGQGAVTVASRVQDAAGNDSGWITGTAATRDTVAPPAPTAARILLGALNPVDTINIANAAAVPVTITTNGAASSVEARLTRSAVNVYGTQAGTGTVVASVNATTLADGGAGTVAVAARQFDLAGNPSAWFTGTAALKDTIVPNNPNFARITFTNRWGNRFDRVDGTNGALGSRDEVRIHDYADGLDYPAAGYDASNNQGAFGRNNIDNGTVPRILGYDVRDSAWNPIARICRRYTGNGTGAAYACP